MTATIAILIQKGIIEVTPEFKEALKKQVAATKKLTECIEKDPQAVSRLVSTLFGQNK